MAESQVNQILRKHLGSQCCPSLHGDVTGDSWGDPASPGSSQAEQTAGAPSRLRPARGPGALLSPRGETARVWASRPQAAPASEGTFWKQQPRVGWAEDTTSHVLGCRVHVTQVGAYAAALSPAPRATGQRPEDVCASPGDRAGRALARMPVLDPWAMRSSGDRCGERAARRALLRAPRSHRPRLATVGRSRPGPWDPPRWTVRPRTPRGPPACVATTRGPRPALLAPLPASPPAPLSVSVSLTLRSFLFAPPSFWKVLP